VDLVYKASNAGPAGLLSLVRAQGGELEAWGCTCSVGGKRNDGIAVFQLEPGEGRSGKCQLKQCLVRGMDLVALDVRDPGSQVLFDECLVVGGKRPLLDVRGRNGVPTVVRAARSTFIGRQTFLRIHATQAGDRQPAVEWQALETLISRCGGEQAAAMVFLDGCERDQIRFRVLDCVYAGWPNLLASEAKPIPYSELDVWHQYWNLKDVDVALIQTWPDSVPVDSAEIAKENYQPSGAVAFAAGTSLSSEPLGCNVHRLPPARSRWLTLTYNPFIPPHYDLPNGGPPPEVSAPSEDVYEGEKIDLVESKIDLGEYLAGKKLGRRVVLYLTGSGKVYTSPIRVRDTSLVLYFEKPAEDADPLELWPRKGFPEGREALIEVIDGNLEITNGRIFFLNQRVQMPRHMLRVHGGELRLHGCWLSGALGNAPPWYQGLIAFAGSGRPETDRAAECAIVDTVLASGKSCIHTLGVGGRVRLQNSVVLSGGEAFYLDPGPSADALRPLSALLPWFTANVGGELLLTASLPVWWRACQGELKYPPRERLNTQVLLERNTFAVQGSLVRLGDCADRQGPPADAYIVQGQSNVFVDPSRTSPRRSGILTFDADALMHGLLIWRGEGNVYDSGFRYFLSSTERPSDTPASLAAWTRLWGPAGEVEVMPLALQSGDRRLQPEDPRPEALVSVYMRARIKGPPGSDLIKPPPPMKK
jgi:hypothetical protein